MTPDEIGRKTFTVGRKGFDPVEVQGYLLAVANEVRDARSQALTLARELEAARQEIEASRHIDPARLTALLGEETARVLDAARSAADEMRAKAERSSSQLLAETIANTDELKAKTEESAARMRSEAESAAAALLAEAEAVTTALRTETEADVSQLRASAEGDAARMRAEAAEVLALRTAEAEAEVEVIRARGAELAAQAELEAAAEVERGRQEGREMVAEAQRVRERMLNDLARRRKAFRQQIERLQAGRDRLMTAYDVVRETLDVATEELAVAMPQARLAAEAAALRAADEHEPSFEELEQEAATLPEPVARATPAPTEPSEPATEERDEAASSSQSSPGPAAEAEPEAGGDAEPVEESTPEPPKAPSDSSVEGRHSSSVKVIRTGEHPAIDVEAVPDPPADATTEPTPAPTPAPEPAAADPEPAVAAVALEVDASSVEAPADEPAGDADPDGPAEGDDPAVVSSLFARLREETTVEVVVADDEGVEVVVEQIEIEEEVVIDEAELAELTALAESEAEAAVDEAPPLDVDHALLARRDEALVDIERNLGRRIKRELSDEQNELLDTVRRQRGAPTVEALPEAAAHVARYRTAALPSLVAAATAGGELLADSGIELGPAAKAGGKAGDLAGELATELVEPLRQRLARCFDETAGDADELAERLRACYREWKGQRVDELVSRLSLAAANRGLVDRLPEGSLVHWVVDDGATPSPDCDDNALAGDIPRGEDFPTGHQVPPVSATCHCLVAPKRD